MARRRYFRAEVQWVFGICAECREASLVARIPRTKERKCEKCLRRHRRLEKERTA